MNQLIGICEKDVLDVLERDLSTLKTPANQLSVSRLAKTEPKSHGVFAPLPSDHSKIVLFNGLRTNISIGGTEPAGRGKPHILFIVQLGNIYAVEDSIKNWAEHLSHAPTRGRTDSIANAAGIAIARFDDGDHKKNIAAAVAWFQGELRGYERQPGAPKGQVGFGPHP